MHYFNKQNVKFLQDDLKSYEGRKLAESIQIKIRNNCNPDLGVQ